MTNAALFKRTFNKYATEVWAMPESEFLKWLNDQTDVPDIRVGKWIRTAGDYIGDDVSGFYDYHWSCSECEREAITNDWNIYELSDYCPHCGAKMEGVTSDEL